MIFQKDLNYQKEEQSHGEQDRQYYVVRML